MQDLGTLLPHTKTDSKLDTKNDRAVINEVAELKGCSSVVFFESRKHTDLYMWMAKTPAGPTVKFHVANVHTMAELKLTGNHLKGSRSVLSFHPEFDAQPHLQVLKELLTHIFVVPSQHRKMKPFIDHVLSFTVLDGRIWVRNYQIVHPQDRKGSIADTTLTEVGPRMCLNPIRIFEGSFGGPTLFDNPDYVSPNKLRAEQRKQRGQAYESKVLSKQKRNRRKLVQALTQVEPQRARSGRDARFFAGGGDDDDDDMYDEDD